MKVLVATIGTRGDVQPYVALAEGLVGAGHDVTLCANSKFEPFVRDRGLSYAYLNNELVDLLESHEVRAMMERTTNLLGVFRTAFKLAGRLKPIGRKLIDDCWAAVQSVQPDVIVFHAKLTQFVHFAQKIRVPAIMAPLVPQFVVTAKTPTMGFPNLKIAAYNRATYKLVLALINVFGGKAINRWRAANGLPKVGMRFNTMCPQGTHIPVIHGFSPSVVPVPNDWPSNVTSTGYWFLNADDDWRAPEGLVKFLAAGDPPVYCGFGSMVGLAPERMTRIVIEAMQLAGVRGILATGWGGLRPTSTPETMYLLDEVPHDWLFPQVAAVIHHGGAGTTAAGLRFGCPTIVCPLMVDQPYWGGVIHRLGVGPAPIWQRKLTADKLAVAIREVAQNPPHRQQAERVARQLSAEDGVATAVAFIERVAGR